MPQVIPIATYYGAATLGAGAFTAAAVAVVASFATNDYQQRKAARDQREAFNASLQDRLVAVATTDQRRSRVYGEVRNTDGIIFKGTHGDKSQYFLQVVALAGHESEAIGDVFFNDQRVTLLPQEDSSYLVGTEPYMQVRATTVAAGGGNTVTGHGTYTFTLASDPLPGSVVVWLVGTLTEGVGGPTYTTNLEVVSVLGRTVTVQLPLGPYYNASVFHTFQRGETSYYARVWKYLGASTQNLGADLLASRFPGVINTPGNDDRFSGITLLVTEFYFNEEAFSSGVPQVSAVVKGVKNVYDPRTDSYGWTENPALCARDWARYKYGGDCSPADIDDALVIAAANVCDTPTVFDTPDGPQTRPLYQCGIVCPIEGDPSPSMDSMIEAMAGKWGWPGGVLAMVAGAWRMPVVEITEDWLSGVDAIEISPSLPTAQSVNIYKASIANADADPATPLSMLEQMAGDNSLSPKEKPTVSSALAELQNEQPDIDDIADGAGLSTERATYDAALAALTAYINGLTVPHTIVDLGGPTTVVSATFNAKFSNVYEARKVILNTTGVSRPLTNLETVSQAYVFAPVPGIRSQTYIDADGQELPREVKMAAVTHVVHAQHILGVLMRDSREALTVKLPCNLRALKLRLFDTVYLTLPLFGFDMKEFEIVSTEFSMTKGVVLTLKETGAAIFDLDDEFDILDLIPNTTLPQAWYVPYIDEITVTSGTVDTLDGTPQSRTLVTWSPPDEESIRNNGHIEVQYVLADGYAEDDVWESVTTAGSTDRVLIVGLLVGQPYLFRLRAINSIPVKGPWSLQRLHVIADPPNDAAEAAQDAADLALAQLSDIASDNVLSPGEKPQVILDVQVIHDEQADIDAKADAQGIVGLKADYDDAVVLLESYLASLTSPVAWDNLTGKTTIVGTVFRQKFADVYNTRQLLLNEIAILIKQGSVSSTVQDDFGERTGVYTGTPSAGMQEVIYGADPFELVITNPGGQVRLDAAVRIQLIGLPAADHYACVLRATLVDSSDPDTTLDEWEDDALMMFQRAPREGVPDTHVCTRSVRLFRQVPQFSGAKTFTLRFFWMITDSSGDPPSTWGSALPGFARTRFYARGTMSSRILKA